MVDDLNDLILANSHVTFEVTFNESIDLIDDLGYDSISLINLVISIEKKYMIEIPDDLLLMENLRSYIKINKIVTSCIQLRSE